MSAVRLVFRAETRRQWRAWLAVVILISAVGGLVLAAAAAGRRTESAFPRFVATHGFDSFAFAIRPAPQLAHLPGVSAVTEETGAFAGLPSCDCTHPINPADLSVGVVGSSAWPVMRLVSGRWPDPSAADQVLASYTLERSGVHVGSVIRVPFYAPSQLSAAFRAPGALTPLGPTVAFHVTGFVVSEGEFPSGATPAYDLFGTPAFARTVIPRTAAVYEYFVRLRRGTAGLARFDAQASAHAQRKAGVEGYQNTNTQAASVEASIRPQAVGWWILAGLATLVGLAVIGQALARQAVTGRRDYPTLAALGADHRQLIALGMARNAAVALCGAAGAVAVATALSPLAPMGEARIAEESTGVALDPYVLQLGALGVVAAVFVLGLWPAVRAAHTVRQASPAQRHPSAVLTGLTAASAPPSVLIGVHHALQRKSDGLAVPVPTALLGTVLAVAALCGTAIFAASLSHLLATPALYGDPFQLNFSNTGRPDPALLESLKHHKGIARISRGFATETSIGTADVGGVAASAVRGQLLFSAVSGHLPSADGQVGLGSTTMRQIGARVGSVVQVTLTPPSGRKRTVPFRVVSQVSFPVISGAVELGRGALFTVSGYEHAACPAAPGLAACRKTIERTGDGGILASVAPGPAGQTAIAHYADAYQAVVSLPTAPASLINFGEAVNFPLIFGAVFAVFGAATLAHLLVVSVSRRRREIGLLKVVGFVNRQVTATVAWQATTLAVVGIVVGAPLGVAAGQVLWRAFAGNLGVIPVAVVPRGLIVVLVAGIIVAANLIAVGPGLAAMRSKPAPLLRTM